MRVIALTKGFVTVISAEDFRRVNRHKWHVHMSKGTRKKLGQPYARANICGKKVYLHRFITDAPELTHVDHINHQTLDNRRLNLKITDYLTNLKRRRRKLCGSKKQ